VLKLNDRSFEETDKRDGKPVMVWRWQFDPDGKTAHVRMKEVASGDVVEAVARKQ
jgi:hypothetical protein